MLLKRPFLLVAAVLFVGVLWVGAAALAPRRPSPRAPQAAPVAEPASWSAPQIDAFSDLDAPDLAAPENAPGAALGNALGNALGAATKSSRGPVGGARRLYAPGTVHHRLNNTVLHSELFSGLVCRLPAVGDDPPADPLPPPPAPGPAPQSQSQAPRIDLRGPGEDVAPAVAPPQAPLEKPDSGDDSPPQKPSPMPPTPPTPPKRAEKSPAWEDPQNDDDVDELSVSFARESLELKAPGDWHVAEAPRGREVRLVLSPETIVARRMPEDGMWIVCHLPPVSAAELPSLLDRRVKMATGDRAAPTPAANFSLQTFKGLRRDIQFTEKKLLGSDKPPREFRGMHLLLPLDWTLVEIHALAPASEFKERYRTWEKILSSLRIRAPKPLADTPIETTRDAAELFGAWKSSYGRLVLRGNGRISIEADATRVLTDESSEPPKPLVGEYRSRGDVLEVTWADGSRLNFRWRRSGGRLLLTDHQGRISQLRQLLD